MIPLTEAATVILVPVPEQIVPVPPTVKPAFGNGFTVTTCVVVTGPLHPAALAVIVVVPDHPAAYVTAPVVALILLPAKAAVVASKL